MICEFQKNSETGRYRRHKHSLPEKSRGAAPGATCGKAQYQRSVPVQNRKRNGRAAIPQTGRTGRNFRLPRCGFVQEEGGSPQREAGYSGGYAQVSTGQYAGRLSISDDYGYSDRQKEPDGTVAVGSTL